MVVTVSGGEGRVSVRPGDFAETRWQLGGPRTQVTLRYMVAKFRGERGRRLLCFEDIVKKFYRAITSNDCRRGACRPWRQGGIAEMPLGFSAWFRRTRDIRKLAANGRNRGGRLQCGILSGDRHLFNTSSGHILSCEMYNRSDRVHVLVS
jgi:hypothetical protein